MTVMAQGRRSYLPVGRANVLTIARLLLATSLAGCGGSATSALGGSASPTTTNARTATATSTLQAGASPTPCISGTPGLPATPAPPSPTPIAPSGWSTYTNSAYHYTIQYPSNWYPLDVSPTSGNFKVLNFDPKLLSGAGALIPPPYDGIEVDAFPNPSQQSPIDFYIANQQNAGPGGPAPCSRTLHQLTLAGHEALEVVQWPTVLITPGPGATGPINYPTVVYYVADGTTVLILFESYSPNGRPSGAFAHMLASLTFTS